LTNLSGAASKPSWSPQGDRIAFSVAESGNSEIYVINIDGSGLTRLTDDPALDQDPSWAPDGNQIVFTSNRNGNNELFVMSATTGSGLTNLSNNVANDEEPCWGGMVALTSPTPTTIVLNYWDSFGFGADDWITSVPSASILATFSYGEKTYPALAAVEYGSGRAVYAGGSTFSELYNVTVPGNVHHQLFVNSVKWASKGKLATQSKVLATYGHRELLTYHNGANGIGSNAIAALRERGYAVDVSFNIPSSLAGYDIVIMPGVGWSGTPAYPNPIYWSGDSGHALTSNEISALLNFVREGGGLVASVEYGTGASWMNPIGNPMGVIFAHISSTGGLVGNRIIDHPIFLKWEVD
jgi:TolB protein